MLVTLPLKGHNALTPGILNSVRIKVLPAHDATSFLHAGQVMPVKAVSMLSETLLLNSYLNVLDRLIQIYLLSDSLSHICFWCKIIPSGTALSTGRTASLKWCSIQETNFPKAINYWGRKQTTTNSPHTAALERYQEINCFSGLLVLAYGQGTCCAAVPMLQFSGKNFEVSWALTHHLISPSQESLKDRHQSVSGMYLRRC